MTTSSTPIPDAGHADLAWSRPGRLTVESASWFAPFVEAGVFDRAALHFATRLLANELPEIVLAGALAVQAVQGNDTCVALPLVPVRFRGAPPDPDAMDAAGGGRLAPARGAEPPPGTDAAGRAMNGTDVAEAVGPLPWPDLDEWMALLAESDAVARPDTLSDRDGAPLVLDGTDLYLRRFHLDEVDVADRIGAFRRGEAGSSIADGDLVAMFPTHERDPDNRPLSAARRALSSRFTVLTGGPGTGKTWTLARILAALWTHDPTLDVTLAAPTGKAAMRMREAVATAARELGPAIARRLESIEPKTLHRAIGLRPGQPPRHHEHHPIPEEVVIVDEASMISLPLMADLLRAIRPGAHLILVGDPYQLASVEAGSVLSDLVSDDAGIADSVAELRVNHRSVPELAAIFDAVNAGDADETISLLAADTAPIRWIDTTGCETATDVTERTSELLDTVLAAHGRSLMEAAAAKDDDRCAELLTTIKVLCATRRGPLGVARWTERIEGQLLPRAARHRSWYDGRPIIATRNDYVTGLLNGDTGVCVDDRVIFPGRSDRPSFAPEQLGDIDTWWAMTIHKSQGSEFDHVVVSLAERSRINSRELLYTALTRARKELTIVASEATLREAVARRTERSSGLARRLRQFTPSP